MLVGVVAFNVLNVMDPTDPASVGVLLVGYFFQGTPSPDRPPLRAHASAQVLASS